MEGPTAGLTQGPQIKIGQSTRVNISSFSFSVRERLWSMDGVVQMQVENSPEGVQSMLQRSCGVFPMPRPKFVLGWICLSLSLDFISCFVFMLSLLSTSLNPLPFSFLLLLIITAQQTSCDHQLPKGTTRHIVFISLFQAERTGFEGQKQHSTSQACIVNTLIGFNYHDTPTRFFKDFAEL